MSCGVAVSCSQGEWIKEDKDDFHTLREVNTNGLNTLTRTDNLILQAL